MKIANRYASAVNSSNLKVDYNTHTSDTDVLGAYGIADRDLERGSKSNGDPVTPCPLAVPLERLFSGDNRAAHRIVDILADMAFNKSWKLRVKLDRSGARDMAQACLAWHRNGTCKPCGGLGYSIIPGTKTLSERPCESCFDHATNMSTGKIPFERQFKPDRRELARWLVTEIELAAGHAGPAAMQALAPRLNLE